MFITLNSAYYYFFVCFLLVKMIVAQISGRHLFEHWKATHNFYRPEQVFFFFIRMLQTFRNKSEYVRNLGLTVEEVKSDLLLSAFTELL